MSILDLNKQIEASVEEAEFSLKHLEYSLGKVQKIGLPNLDDMEALETWESFTSRFSRLSDILAKKLLRSLVLKGDPSFRGSLMDFLNQGEKLGYISDANKWWAIRSLRNKEAHEYNRAEIIPFFKSILAETEFVVSETKELLRKNAAS